MNYIRILYLVFILIVNTCFIYSCIKDKNNFDVNLANRKPVIEPDYIEITVPPNIAPLNFVIQEKGDFFKVRISSNKGVYLEMRTTDGIVKFSKRSWIKILKNSNSGVIKIEIFSGDETGNITKYDPFLIKIAKESIDPYICYRLLYPGYESWREMQIVQRSTESFKKSSIVENKLLSNNCVNCHTFSQHNPEKFLFHARGLMGGTYFIDGNNITKRELRTKEMDANAVYSSWHPTEDNIVFSSNKIVQSFHAIPEKNIEIYDLASTLYIYFPEKNEMSRIDRDATVQYMETYPYWSPDGNYLYYCRTKQINEIFDYKKVKYDLVRRYFDQSSKSFGDVEEVFSASDLDKSVSLPAISPNGQFLVFTLHNYGTFPVWHREADLYILNLLNGKVDRMPVNSEETESYHSWSSNSKWLVFSSKRGDGLTSRPYFVYVGSLDSIGKPFVLPQKDPELYAKMTKTFNRPEFVIGKINVEPREFYHAFKSGLIEVILTDFENQSFNEPN